MVTDEEIVRANSNMGLLDAIGKFEINELVNVWFGRMLVPTERGELNGPFYHAVFDGFRTPLNQSDFSGNFGSGGAGLYGRDNGVVFYGKIHPGGTHLQYVAGDIHGTAVKPGVGPNQRNSLKYAGRLTWNLLNEEKNPGYYTSGTYYGTAGDILAIAVGGEYQNAGAGSFQNQAAYGNLTSDVLFEKVSRTKGCSRSTLNTNDIGHRTSLLGTRTLQVAASACLTGLHSPPMPCICFQLR